MMSTWFSGSASPFGFSLPFSPHAEPWPLCYAKLIRFCSCLQHWLHDGQKQDVYPLTYAVFHAACLVPMH